MIQAENFDTSLARQALPALRKLKRCHEENLDTGLPEILEEIIEGFEIVANDYEDGESQRALNNLTDSMRAVDLDGILHFQPHPGLAERYRQAHSRADEKVERSLTLFAENFRRLWC